MTILVFAGLVVLILLAGVAISSVVLRHARAPGVATVADALGGTLPKWPALGLSAVLVAVFMAVIVYLVGTIVRRTWREWHIERAWFSSVVALLFCLLLRGSLCRSDLPRESDTGGGRRH